MDDLDAAIAFFVELGMEPDGGTTPVEGNWVDSVIGLDDVRRAPLNRPPFATQHAPKCRSVEDESCASAVAPMSFAGYVSLTLHG